MTPKKANRNAGKRSIAVSILLLILTAGCPAVLSAHSLYLPLILKNSGQPSGTLQNGDFEKGTDGSWKVSSSNGSSLILDKSRLYGSPQSGNWAAWLGMVDNETSTLSQTVSIPADAATLNYYYRMESWETLATCGNDMAYVKIGGTLLKSYDLCNINNKLLWTLEKIPIPSNYKGQVVELSFQVINDFDLVSDFFLDTVSIATTTGQ
jgi:hypothetical protein